MNHRCFTDAGSESQSPVALILYAIPLKHKLKHSCPHHNTALVHYYALLLKICSMQYPAKHVDTNSWPPYNYKLFFLSLICYTPTQTHAGVNHQSPIMTTSPNEKGLPKDAF
jgi:hypothetical protein